MRINVRKIVSTVIALVFLCNVSIGNAAFLAGELNLPVPGTMLAVSPAFMPPVLRGMTVYPDQPLRFDFILDSGNDRLLQSELEPVSRKLVNYFLASLTIPQNDLWVNLSPYEQERILPESLVRTELGRDLLAQDYLLKQLSASLLYPESGAGKVFWQRVYAQAYQKFGTTDVPVDTFNKIWIVPQRAKVYEKNNVVYVVGGHLKVMLEADHTAMQQSRGGAAATADVQRADASAEMTKKIVREIIIPVIEKEVNEGKNFATLRQILYSLVLAQWYKSALKDSILNKVYSDQNKMSGVDVSDPANREKIYAQYMAAYKKGVFNYIIDGDRLQEIVGQIGKSVQTLRMMVGYDGAKGKVPTNEEIL